MVYNEAHPDANVIWGCALDPDLEDEMRITIIATGFEKKPEDNIVAPKRPAFGASVAKPVVEEKPVVEAPVVEAEPEIEPVVEEVAEEPKKTLADSFAEADDGEGAITPGEFEEIMKFLREARSRNKK